MCKFRIQTKISKFKLVTKTSKFRMFRILNKITKISKFKKIARRKEDIHITLQTIIQFIMFSINM